jgi:hypothetical protein
MTVSPLIVALIYHFQDGPTDSSSTVDLVNNDTPNSPTGNTLNNALLPYEKLYPTPVYLQYQCLVMEIVSLLSSITKRRKVLVWMVLWLLEGL